MRRLWFKLRIRLYALSQLFSINIGSKVIYRGSEYEVCNGVRQNSWRLEPSADLPDDGWVRRNECRKVLSFRNLLQTYRFFIQFYEGYWLDIWAKGLQRLHWW